MAICNTTQKEIGGKDLILKKCKEFTAVSTTATDTEIVVTAHNCKVGDVVKFTAVDGNTTINTTSFYAVVTVVDANTIEVALAPGGTPIVLDDTSVIVALLLFRTLGGLRSKEFSFSSEAVDVTNVDSEEWKSMLDNAGIRSASVSGSGVYTSEDVFQEFRSDFLNNALTCIMLIDAKTKELYEGCFKISELSVSGDYDAEGQYSMSAESSGPVTIFAFP
jgi:TP901-1 family phage major tail protein